MDLRTLNYFVAVAEELHFGRAATRLHLTQPPLSRAIKQLETELGCLLLRRSPAGVALTPAGTTLYDEAKTLLARADQVRARVAAAAGADTVTVGTLAELADARLVTVFRDRHPGVNVRIREADLTDPTVGLRAGLVDVALTRAPFDDTGIVTRVLRTDPIGVVLRTDDPLAGCDCLGFDDLADRRCVQLPEGTDPVWRAFWNGPADGSRHRDGPVVRTVHECVQSVLWNGAVGLTPMIDTLPEGLISVPLNDMPPSRLVVAWAGGNPSPLVRSFVQIAAGLYRTG
ncbi:MAG TPA: LysR family transcriptional regulator [Pseudonocardiaceae bacterium]|jgi:DNA-binding transcriptional LysR family regulator|nr:LysR family transcriptional regulator [Pseudonocardiaceae bacterium]